MANFVIETSQIRDWDSFHDVFQDALKFFEGYGRNMDAWIDCMSDFHGDTALSNHQLPEGESIALVLRDAEDFRKRCPEIANELFDCAAFVNRRYIGWGRIERVTLIPE